MTNFTARFSTHVGYSKGQHAVIENVPLAANMRPWLVSYTSAYAKQEVQVNLGWCFILNLKSVAVARERSKATQVRPEQALGCYTRGTMAQPMSSCIK